MNILLSLLVILSPAFAQMKVEALRLKPGQDIRKELEAYVQKENIEAASVISAVGSVSEGALRLANKKEKTIFKGPLEVLSLTGTISKDGTHLHMAFSDGEGKTFGGHLTEGNRVYTTLEIVLGIYPHLSFKRTMDRQTGFHELEITKKK